MLISPIYKYRIEEVKNKKNTYYAVNADETLDSISQKFGIPSYELKKMNGLKTNQIYPGQVLYLNKPKENTKRVLNTKNLKPIQVNDSLEKKMEIKNPIFSSNVGTSKEWEEYQYRSTTYGFLGFTESKQLEEKESKLKIDHCLTAVTLILDHQAYSPDGENTLPKIPRKNWTYFYTLYFDGDGKLVLGEKNQYIYTTQIQNVGSGPYANENKIISPIDKNQAKMISTHEDLFLNQIIKFNDGTVFDMKEVDNQVFKKVLETISIFNRRGGMNYIYSSIKEEKEKVAKVLGIANLIALPFDIPKITNLQKVVGIIFYLLGMEQLIESFNEDTEEYKGPIMLSPIFFYDYEIKDFGNGNKKQILTKFETLESSNIWESYQDIGLTKK